MVGDQISVALLFDVDGTLTPNRGTMDPSFRTWFLGVQERYPVYLVTGSDRQRTIDQVSPELYNRSRIAFNCCGNEAWQGDQLLYRNEWSPAPELIAALEEELEKASYSPKTGRHIEYRTGLINFSILGRGASLRERADYIAYDSTSQERRSLVATLGERFQNLEFAVAGDIGIDIYPRGRDKSQALAHIKETRTVFFGDDIFEGGNDYGIALRCSQHHRVDGWENTWRLLESITSK